MLITYTGTGERVDTRLSKEFSCSRNFFHHIISRGGISVNDAPVKKSYKLKYEDIIFIDNLERYLSPIILEEAPDIEIPILVEKEDYLIINKPKGVLSHPNSVWDVKQPSVIGFLYHRFKDLPSYGNFIRAGLIHRLDKDTDGIMVIAKTEQGLQHFKGLFQAKSEVDTLEEKEKVPLQKYYKATVEVTEKGKKFLQGIEKNGIRNLPNHWEGCYYIQEEVIAKIPHYIPKMGITKIEHLHFLDVSGIDGGKPVLESSERIFCTVFLQILTGRTHQIRYHLSHKGLPIIGDYLYGIKDNTPLQLSAYKLLYQDIDGEIRIIEV